MARASPSSADDRPEVEAALAAAAAELDHPEPLPPGMGADAVMQALPAAEVAR